MYPYNRLPPQKPSGRASPLPEPKENSNIPCPLVLPPSPLFARAAVRSGQQPTQSPVVGVIDELLEELLAAATEPGEVGIRFPGVVGFGVAFPLDLELGRSLPLAPAHYAFDVVLGLTGTRDVDRRGRGLLAGVVHLISLELGHIAGPADAQVLRYVELEGVLSASL